MAWEVHLRARIVGARQIREDAAKVGVPHSTHGCGNESNEVQAPHKSPDSPIGLPCPQTFFKSSSISKNPSTIAFPMLCALVWSPFQARVRTILSRTCCAAYCDVNAPP